MAVEWDRSRAVGIQGYSTQTASHGRQLIRGVFALLVLVVLLGFAVPSYLFLSLSAGTVAVMMIPYLGNRQIDLLSPWSWLLYSSFISIFLRGIYITFDIPDEYTIKSVFLLREEKDFLIWPAMVVLLGVCFATFGYLMGSTNSRKIRWRIFQSSEWNTKRLWVVLPALLLISWIGFYLFIASTGGSLDTENLSAHRGLSNDLSEYGAYGYLRWMVNLSDLAFYLSVANMVYDRRVRVEGIIVSLLSIGTSAFYYFYVQNRSGILVIGFNTLALLYYLRGRYLHGGKFPIKLTLVVAPIALLLFRWMTILRQGSGYAGTEALDLNPFRAIEPMVVNNGGFDVSKTAHIMGSIGRQLDYQWGGTLLSIFTIWIPRQFWPSKPPNVDTQVGMAIYGAQTYGAGAVPPGLIGEMYWNFWLLGVMVGCFLLGLLLQYIYSQFRPYLTNRNTVLLYTTSFMQIGVALMGSGFASAVMSLLMASAPLVIVLHFITKRDGSPD